MVAGTKRVYNQKRFVFDDRGYTVSSKYIGTKGKYPQSTMALTLLYFFPYGLVN